HKKRIRSHFVRSFPSLVTFALNPKKTQATSLNSSHRLVPPIQSPIQKSLFPPSVILACSNWSNHLSSEEIA
ncbi:unnamed protein product, partial [Linum tenue]